MSRTRRKSLAARKGKWPPRGTGTTVLTYPCPSQPCFGGSKGCARVTGKAGEKGQYSGVGRQLTLDKTVTHGLSKLRLNPGWGSGQPGSGVAVDWVTSRSYSSAPEAKRRLNAQSGLRKDWVFPASSSVAVRDRGPLKKVSREADGPVSRRVER